MNGVASPHLRSSAVSSSARHCVPLSWPLTLAFVGLGVIVLCNLNGVLAMTTKGSRILSPLILALCVAIGLLCREPLGRAMRPVLPWLPVFFIVHLGFGTVVGVANSSNNRNAMIESLISQVASLFIIWAFAVAAFHASRRGQQLALTRWIFLVSLVSSASVFLDVLYPGWSDFLQFRRQYSGRACGFFANPNELGFMAGFTVTLGASLSLLSRKPLWFVLGGTVGLCAGFLSFSKTAILLLLALLPVTGWYVVRAGVNMRNALVVGMCITGVVGLLNGVRGDLTSGVGVLGGAEQVRRVGQLRSILLEGEMDDELATGRFTQLKEGLQLWMASPLIGHGLNSMVRMPASGLGPHNTPVLVLGESGLVGFALFAITGACYLRAAWRARTPWLRVLVLPAALVMLAMMMTGHQWLDDRPQNAMFGFCLGLVAAQQQLTPRRAARGSSSRGNARKSAGTTERGLALGRGKLNGEGNGGSSRPRSSGQSDGGASPQPMPTGEGRVSPGGRL